MGDKKTQRWWTEDKIAVAVARLGDVPCLVLSAHGESRGQTCRQILQLAKSLHEEMSDSIPKLEMLVAMDSNVKTGNTGAAANPESLLDMANQLGFSSCTASSLPSLKYAGPKGVPAKHTVLKTRGFLQPQLKGKAGVPDENMKDYIFYHPSEVRKHEKLQGRVLNHVEEEDSTGLYMKGGMPRSLDFPSDHAIVIVEAFTGPVTK